MPLQRGIGFIYDSPNTFVIAHELAHGTFNLRHTFSPEELIAAENTTQNLMDYKGGSELWKHQWELIHDPENMLFAWAQDESEGEMTDVFGIIKDIRKANQNENYTLSVAQDKCPLGYYENVKLGENTLGVIQINCSKDFENAILDKTITNKLIEWKLTSGSKVVIKPSEKAKVFAQTTVGDVVYYKFHEVKEQPVPLLGELTDKFLFEFAVLKKDAPNFEDYIYSYEYSLSVEWVSQFNTMFNKCKCWADVACCLRACHYMIGLTNCANCDDPVIKENSPYLVKERIEIATFTDASNWKTEYDSKSLKHSDISTFERGLKYLKNEIKNNSKPVIIGVHYSNRGVKPPPGNPNVATYHFMVVVGYGKDSEGEYLWFYDPNYAVDDKDAATNKIINKLRLEDNFIKGDYRDKVYTITDICVYN